MVLNADLHTHTIHSSDSDITPRNLIREAKNLGIKHIAITDHDSLGGIPEALKAGLEFSIDVISGVELHSGFGEILAYFIDYKNPKLMQLCQRNKKAMNERALKVIALLKKDGFNIDSELMKKKYNVKILERPIIAKEMVALGYVSSFKEAFDRFLAKGQKYALEPDLLSTEEVIKIVVQAHGVPVLAHPYFEDYESEFKNINVLIKAGLAGIESVKLEGRTPENYDKVVEMTKELAKQYSLVITSGSDYHGTVHPYNKLGKTNCDEDIVLKLKFKAQIIPPRTL